MVLGRLVPWRSWEEWEDVRQGLCSPEHSQQRTSALQQVQTNRSSYHGTRINAIAD